MTRRLAFLLAAAGLLPAAHAAEQPCDAATLAVVGKFAGVAGLSTPGDDGPLSAAACKPAPDKPSVMLAAVAWWPPGARHDDDFSDKPLVVATIDRARARVIASYRATISEDTITQLRPGGLVLDTARYQLAPGLRAFALRFDTSGRFPGAGEANWDDELTLLVPEGDTLRPVLKLDMSQGRLVDRVWQLATSTLAVAATRSHGYADLLLRTTIEMNPLDPDKVVAKPRVESVLLRYDGRTYVGGSADAWWLDAH